MTFSPRRTLGFWVLAATLVVFFAASSVPTPLYVVYQEKWHFSAITLTLIFAVYAAALLITLLTAGGLSDYLGRRRVLAGALVVELLSMGAFVAADGVGWLLVARAVQGVATGAAAGALSAGVADLTPPGRPALAAAVNTAAPTTGIAVGAVTSGALVQYAPAPRVLVFAALIVLFSALLVALAVVPETVVRRPGSLRSLQPRASVPVAARRTFRSMAPVLIATWAVGGLVLSLGPSLAAGVFGITNHLVGGLVVTAVAGLGTTGAVLTRGWAPQSTMLHGAFVLVAGVGLVLGSLATGMDRAVLRRARRQRVGLRDLVRRRVRSRRRDRHPAAARRALRLAVRRELPGVRRLSRARRVRRSVIRAARDRDRVRRHRHRTVAGRRRGGRSRIAPPSHRTRHRRGRGRPAIAAAGACWRPVATPDRVKWAVSQVLVGI